jgi:hypothetical protein
LTKSRLFALTDTVTATSDEPAIVLAEISGGDICKFSASTGGGLVAVESAQRPNDVHTCPPLQPGMEAGKLSTPIMQSTSHKPVAPLQYEPQNGQSLSPFAQLIWSSFRVLNFSSFSARGTASHASLLLSEKVLTAKTHTPEEVHRASEPQSLSAMQSHLHLDVSGSQWLPVGQSSSARHAGGLRSICISLVRSFLTEIAS